MMTWEGAVIKDIACERPLKAEPHHSVQAVRFENIEAFQQSVDVVKPKICGDLNSHWLQVPWFTPLSV